MFEKDIASCDVGAGSSHKASAKINWCGRNAWNTNFSGTPLNIAVFRCALRVVAGPGTAKTYALMRRVARLLEQYVQPNRVLAISFTRTAANDLVDKLA